MNRNWCSPGRLTRGCAKRNVVTGAFRIFGKYPDFCDAPLAPRLGGRCAHALQKHVSDGAKFSDLDHMKESGAYLCWNMRSVVS